MEIDSSFLWLEVDCAKIFEQSLWIIARQLLEICVEDEAGSHVAVLEKFYLDPVAMVDLIVHAVRFIVFVGALGEPRVTADDTLDALFLACLLLTHSKQHATAVVFLSILYLISENLVLTRLHDL